MLLAMEIEENCSIILEVIVHAIFKPGGHGFESYLSSLFLMKIEKRALRFISLPCLCSLNFRCIFLV